MAVRTIQKKKVRFQKNKQTLKSSIEPERILVPIDFSDHSKNALKYAIPFAKRFNATIDLIYVVEPAVYPADFSIGQLGFPNIEKELQRRGKRHLIDLIKTNGAERIVKNAVVRTGKPFFEINQYAFEENIAMIIIATHGHSGVEHILFGSTVEKVIRKAPCHVLVLRKSNHYGKMKN